MASHFCGDISSKWTTTHRRYIHFFSFLVPDLALLSYLTALYPSLAFSYCLAMLSCLPIWQPGLGAEDGLTGISHQLYTCLPWNSATDFPLGVEVTLPLELQHFDTHQTLTTLAVHATSSDRVWLLFFACWISPALSPIRLGWWQTGP